MADLGLYNFIKAQLANGTPKASIIETLEKNGTPREAIDAAFAAVETGAAPTPAVSQKQSETQGAIPASGRPLAITVFCILYGIEWLFIFLSILGIAGVFGIAYFNNPSSGTAVLVFIPMLVIILVGAAVLYGYWRMRKWGVYLYTCLVFFSLLTSITNPLRLLSLGTLLAIFGLGVGYKYLSQMT